MTEENILKLKEKYKNELAEKDLEDLEQKWKLVDDKHFEEFNNVSVKNKGVAFVLSFFFGGLGADRYYVGPWGFGIFKLVVFLILGIASGLLIYAGIKIDFADDVIMIELNAFFIVIGCLVELIALALRIAEMVFSYRDCKIENYNSLLRVYNKAIRV